MKKISQNRMILKHLETQGTINQLDALNKYRCMRLASRINDLKNMGYRIKSRIIFTPESKYAEYSLTNSF